MPGGDALQDRQELRPVGLARRRPAKSRHAPTLPQLAAAVAPRSRGLDAPIEVPCDREHDEERSARGCRATGRRWC